ncbi:polysulfide reductase NrfD [Ramlibacter sp. AW1]|uniref:Polysulfide reductase NrfD n=1 Tax=Ramlibacter aurantiacus TaxID=2801330 RepID=A0A936ZT20_9BURK|nr:NrfD/PsrC family molybdoenzyme membrane anchor subunit [Ramlibacter aurantiacus]MBL0420615.1 polysulfide reductase NrfD [Ramlibacter aurantiacus]
MVGAPSSTWFTASPHWHWLIVLYFILGALAGGTYFLSAMIDLTRREADRRLARLGYYITLPLLLVIGVVLIVDLARPDRFWHLLVANHTLRPMFKWWVPMSTGSWAVPLLGFFSLLSFVASFAEHRRPDWRTARRLRPPGWLGVLVAVPGALVALYVTGYTGVMLSVLNRPVWSDTPLFGLLFVVSAVTMSAALLTLGARWLRWQSPAVAALHRIWVWLLVVQVAVLVALFVSLGPAARGWLNVWGVVLALGIAIGIVLPLLAAMRRRGSRAEAGLPLAAALVLAGGFMVRAAVVFVPEANTP